MRKKARASLLKWRPCLAFALRLPLLPTAVIAAGFLSQAARKASSRLALRRRSLVTLDLMPPNGLKPPQWRKQMRTQLHPLQRPSPAGHALGREAKNTGCARAAQCNRLGCAPKCWRRSGWNEPRRCPAAKGASVGKPGQLTRCTSFCCTTAPGATRLGCTLGRPRVTLTCASISIKRVTRPAEPSHASECASSPSSLPISTRCEVPKRSSSSLPWLRRSAERTFLG
jgi:hypothetical protein